MHAYTAVNRGTRSGKYRRTMEGSNTLPIPVPANATALPASSTAIPGASARANCPALMRTSARMMPPSRPRWRATRGAVNPDTAKRRGGSVPSSPTSRLETGMSTRMSVRMGEIAATA